MKYHRALIIGIFAVFANHSFAQTDNNGLAESSDNAIKTEENGDFDKIINAELARVEESQRIARNIRDLFSGVGLFNFEDKDSFSMTLDRSKLKTIEQCQDAQEKLNKLITDIQNTRKNYDSEERLDAGLRFNEKCSEAEYELKRLESIGDQSDESDGLKKTKAFIKKCNALNSAKSDIETYISQADEVAETTIQSIKNTIQDIEKDRLEKMAMESQKAFNEEVRGLVPFNEEEYIVPIFACNRATNSKGKISPLITRISGTGNGFYAGLLASSSTYCFSSNHKIYVIPIIVEDDKGKPAAVYEEIGQGEVEDFIADKGGKMIYVPIKGLIGLSANQPVNIGISGTNGLPHVYMARDRR